MSRSRPLVRSDSQVPETVVGGYADVSGGADDRLLTDAPGRLNQTKVKNIATVVTP